MTGPIDVQPDGWTTLSGWRELWSREVVKKWLVRDVATLLGTLKGSEDVEEVLLVTEARRKYGADAEA